MLLLFSHALLAAVSLLLFVVVNDGDAYELKCPNLRVDGRGYDPYEDDEMMYRGGYYRDHGAECQSASDNTRGQYSSRALKPCVFSFHSHEGEDGGSSYRASTVCSEKNKINKDIIQEYIRLWPDECVGDFSRCYSVDRDEDIFRDFFCKTKPTWKIPENTTHISVSCVEDKKANIADKENRADDERSWHNEQEKQFLMRIEKEEQHMRHIEMIAAIAFFLSFTACLVIVKCVYSNLLHPYYDRLATHDE